MRSADKSGGCTKKGKKERIEWLWDFIFSFFFSVKGWDVDVMGDILLITKWLSKVESRLMMRDEWLVMTHDEWWLMTDNEWWVMSDD